MLHINYSFFFQNDMNLSEAKKTPLLNMPDDYKRKMLVMHLKGASDVSMKYIYIY